MIRLMEVQITDRPAAAKPFTWFIDMPVGSLFNDQESLEKAVTEALPVEFMGGTTLKIAMEHMEEIRVEEITC